MMTAMKKYQRRAEKAKSLLCVGLDSDVSRLPKSLKKEKFPQFAFNKKIIDATHEFVCAYKPNLAFYEANGEQGIHELKLTIEYLHAEYPEILTIADAKRGDIDSTNNGYVKSIFDGYGFDAITLHPYFGRESLRPFLERSDKACIILCRGSNPGGEEFQGLKVGENPLWLEIAMHVAEKWNEHKNCMLVMGATYPEEMRKARAGVGDDMVFLVPGAGAQGGTIENVMDNGASKSGGNLIINFARSIIFASAEKDFAKAAGAEAKRVRDQIRDFAIK